MEDRKFNFRRIINKRNIITFLIFSIFLSIVFVLIYFFHDWALIGAVDGTFASGSIGIGISILSYASNKGIFDVFALGFQNTLSVMKKEGEKKYPGLFEYRELKQTKRKQNEFTCLAYLLSGIIYLIVSLSLYFPMMNSLLS